MKLKFEIAMKKRINYRLTYTTQGNPNFNKKITIIKDNLKLSYILNEKEYETHNIESN